MITLTIQIEEVKPGVLMLLRKPATNECISEDEEAAFNRVILHVNRALEEEAQRMGEAGWSTATEGPASVLSDETIEAKKREIRKTQ